MKELAPPSSFFTSQLPRLRTSARLGAVVDLACGRGRHALAAAEAGVRVIGIDRNPEFLAELRHRGAERGLPIEPLRADLEAPAVIPLRAASCGAILVFRFLHRPLVRSIHEALAPGGLLLYETFTRRQLELGGGPKSPEFLLADGELPQLFDELEILDCWEGIRPGSRPEAVAQLAARRPERGRW